MSDVELVDGDRVKREKVLLMRELVQSSPDGTSVKVTEKLEAWIEWNPPIYSGYTIPGDWRIVEDTERE